MFRLESIVFLEFADNSCCETIEYAHDREDSSNDGEYLLRKATK